MLASQFQDGVSPKATCLDAVYERGHRQPKACSAIFSSLAATHHSSFEVASAFARPPQASERHWMLPMRMAFAEFLTSSAEDASLELTVTTWYLHHGRYQRSAESRLLSLDAHHTLWYHDICDLWADIMDPTQAAQVHFVRFGPLPDFEHPVPIHLLLVQGHSPLVPVLLTALFEHEVHRRAWHLAALVQEFTSESDVWDILGTNRFCAQRICHLHVNSQRVPQQEALQTQPGDHLRVTILPQQVDAETDGASFMQHMTSVPLPDDECRAAPHFALPAGSPDDSRWRASLADSFYDSAVIEVEEEGSVLYVWTWFINHQTFRQCAQPRIVRLGRCENDWLPSMLDPWQDRMQQDAPTQIGVVHARPPHDMMKIDTVHIMIEQLPAEPVIAGVVSVIFHEDTKDRLLQRALSLPRWLCTDDMVNIMELNPICGLQRCSARVGRIPLEQFIRHDLPSAASIEMHIQPAQCQGDPHAASSMHPYVPRPLMPVSGRSLMQTSRRWQRARRQREVVSEGEPSDRLEDEHHQIPQRIAACASNAPQQPLIAPMWPTTWTTLHDVWSFFFNHANQPFGLQIRAAVWYSDHLRRPWSDDYRLITLDAQLDTWPAHIVQAWHDWFLADSPFEIHVVHPAPLGANAEAQFHVILLQQPGPLHKSVVVTVMDSITDPWQPGQIAVVVPNAIDHLALLHVAVVEFQCPPITMTAHCSTSFGHTDLTAGNLFPVRHGMCFTVAVDTTTTTTPSWPILSSDRVSMAPVSGLHLVQLRARLHTIHQGSEPLQWQSNMLIEILSKADDCFQSPAVTPIVALEAVDVNTASCQDGPIATITQQAYPHAEVYGTDTQPHSKTLDNTVGHSVAGEVSHEVEAAVRHPLRLEDMVPPPMWTYVDCSLIDALRQRLYEFGPPAVQYDLAGVRCTQATSNALHGMPLWTNEVPLAFEFYTDGAFRRSRHTAASGVVLIVYTYDGPCFGGYLTSWCFSTPSAPRAEVTAVTLAVHWACHLVLNLGFAYTKIGFLFDNVYAGAAAQGRCASALNYDLIPIVRSLTLWLEQISFVELAWSHVQGHSEHPWNDLADAVAYGAIDQNYVTTDICALVQRCGGDESALVALQWLWLYEKSLRGDADAPVLHGLQWRFNTGAPLAHQPVLDVQPFELRKTERPAEEVPSDSLCLRLATANVLTLFPQHEAASSFLGARAEHLASQFRDAKIHCAGLQETRCRKVGHEFFEGYHVLSAKATSRGHGGIQLWIAQVIPTQGEPLHITHEHLRILYGDERRLFVRLRHPRLALLFIVLHAPCCDDEQEIQQWWSSTSALFPGQYRTWTCAILCDSNGRLGSITSKAVGGFGAEQETIRGAAFHDWLVAHSLILPQTFVESHHGEHDTWTHAEGSQGRLDFIGVSDNVPLANLRTWVSDDIDLSIARRDHQCVCADVWLPMTRPAPARSATLPLPAEQPRFSWDWDVHTHAARLQLHLKRQLMSQPMRRLRKKHLSEETCELITHKRRALRTLQAAKADSRAVRLRLCFNGWRSFTSGSANTSSSTFHCDLASAIAAEKYRLATLRVCYAVRQDDRRFFDDLAEHTGMIAEKGIHRIWDAIKPLLPRAKNRRKSNIRCAGPTVAQQADHYCELEAGVPTSYQDLLQQCHSSQFDLRVDQPLVSSLKQMPSRLDVENALQRLTAQKAPGIDGITPGCLRDAGPQISEVVSQLFMKMWLTGTEPVQFKGGILLSISKKSNSREVSNMRGIMLIDVLGKLAHSLLHTRFLPALIKWKAPLQMGGFPTCSTVFATHYLRSFHAKTRDRKLASAVLFLDVKSAFHSMIRQVLFGPAQTLPPHLRTILRDAGCDPDALCQMFEQTSSSFHADVAEADRRLLQDAHLSTWFGFPGTDDAFCTARGSRPGSPLADIVFNAMMTHVLRDLHCKLEAHPTLQHGFHELGMIAPPVAWVDDVAVPVVVASCNLLETTLAEVVHITHDVFLQFGLSLNFKAKKTEAVVSFRENSAPAHRHSLFVERLGKLDIPPLHMQLQCVASYEHLGTIFAADCTLQREVAHRRTKAIQAMRQVGKSILRNRHVAIGTRLKLFECLIVPVILHGAGNWDLLPHRLYHSLHASIMSWQRSIINDGCWTPNQHTDFELQCLWKLPPLSLRLAKARLLYAFHCIKSAPSLVVDFVTSVAHQPQSWFAALRQALAWLARMDASFCPPDIHNGSVERILDWFSAQSVHGPQRVRRLYHRCILQFHVIGDIVALHKQLRTTLAEGGVVFEDAGTPSSIPDDARFACDWCVAQFDTKQKLQAHLWTAHQIISDERKFVFSDTCLACRRCFWSSARLQQHLRLSRANPDGCYAQMTWRFAPLTEAHVVEVPDDLRGFARLPAQAVPMPCSLPIENQFATRADAEAALQRAWDLEELPPHLNLQVRQNVFAQADRLLMSWKPEGCLEIDRLLFALTSLTSNAEQEWALYLWCREALHFRRFQHLTLEVFRHVKQEIQSIVFDAPIGRLLDWHFRIMQAHQPQSIDERADHGCSLRDFEPLLDPVHMQHQCLQHVLLSAAHVPPSQAVPISIENGVPTIWILHLFSGRRRRGDCHFWCECCHGILPGYAVRILSVDTAIDAELGNLDRGPVFARMLKIIQKRHFAAGLTGPPCETFSAARHLVLEGERHPRPLRSFDLPWLLHDRSHRELHQTMVGSRLLMHSLIAEVTLVLAGAGSIMEHPTEHPDEQRASVWRTQCHRDWIMQLPGAWPHHIEQWQFGSVGVKPTTLRALNLGPPEVVNQALRENIDPLLLRPSNPLRGRQSDGSFRTAAAKEYPTLLCRALIVATLKGLRHRLAQHGTFHGPALSKAETDWMTSLYSAACQSNLSGTYLPDFQG